MPKALSLKKAHVGSTKSQKPITQFFKNCDDDSESSINCKRKALTQTPTDKLHSHVIKKPKLCILSNGHISTNNIKQSPGKENNIHTNQSSEECIDLSTCDNGLEENHLNITCQSEDRLPLSPLKIDLENGVNHVIPCNGESNVNKTENIQIKVKVATPDKVVNDYNTSQVNKQNRTPKMSPLPEIQCSPSSSKWTPEKASKAELSPAKFGSTLKTLDFGKNDVHNDNMFEDEWVVDDLIEATDCLDLSIIQQCEVVSITNHSQKIEVRLKNASNQFGTCFVEGVWLDTPLCCGENISIIASKNASGQYCVSNMYGLIVLRPNHLMSSTSVVAGVFCRRKALLQERWRGIDSANTAMTMGVLIHELVQKALTQHIISIEGLRKEGHSIIKESIQMLYDAGLSEEEAITNIENYIMPLKDFMVTYVDGKPPSNMQAQKDKWPGHIDNVLDIEENVCCPQLGLKGKIDATLQVTIYDRKGVSEKATVPLELKSGRASMSAEHRGQLVMYGMMLSAQGDRNPATDPQRGLLLYLKDRVELREVSCGYPERRDLVMLRNQLVQYLSFGPQHLNTDPEHLTDIEEASRMFEQKLPEPIQHETACAKCPYLTLCSLHLWHANTDGPMVSDKHPLFKLRSQALSHLSPEHINYFKHWTTLLRIEENGQMIKSPLHSLWTQRADKRAKCGTCAANVTLSSVEAVGDRYLHRFKKKTIEDQEALESGDMTSGKGPQEGEYCVVSIDNRPWIAAGVVSLVNDKEIAIRLERDLSRRQHKDMLYHIDTYESYATTVQNLTNLGVLMEDSDRALRLRKLIIDKEPPEFDKKLPREVGRLGAKLMRSLNIEQQRAVLKALAAKHYTLLQGLPGTGKTKTVSILIQMLVSLKQRVLVTAHTHSAVDNVLSRLPASMKVMRLGADARVASHLLSRTERTLAANCTTAAQLQHVYDSMEVVGVTCLGANHPMLARTIFDVCIVDEATQVLQSTVLRPLLAAERFVLVGDPDQLPPVVRSRAARRLGMEESLFHRVMCEKVTSTLHLQYRMNKPVADVANKVAYSDRLKCGDEKVALATLEIDMQKISHYRPWLLKCCSGKPEDAVLFLDMMSADSKPNVVRNGSNKTLTNLDEACIVIAIIVSLKEGGVKSSDIGVIAPYRDQMSLLRRSLSNHDVEVSTVDQFQGRDKSVIIYSCTRRERDDNQDNRKVKEGEVLNDQRRLAVSVTRAKHKLIVVGDSRAMCRYKPLQRLIEHCNTIVLDVEDITTVCDKYLNIIL